MAANGSAQNAGRGPQATIAGRSGTPASALVLSALGSPLTSKATGNADAAFALLSWAPLVRAIARRGPNPCPRGTDRLDPESCRSPRGDRAAFNRVAGECEMPAQVPRQLA